MYRLNLLGVASHTTWACAPMSSDVWRVNTVSVSDSHNKKKVGVGLSYVSCETLLVETECNRLVTTSCTSCAREFVQVSATRRPGISTDACSRDDSAQRVHSCFSHVRRWGYQESICCYILYVWLSAWLLSTSSCSLHVRVEWRPFKQIRLYSLLYILTTSFSRK